MKRIIVFLALFVFCLTAYAQQTAKVTLKNGTSFTGTITELDPVSHITIVIAGHVTRLEMTDVESIEDIPSPAGDVAPIPESDVVEEDPNYPATYTLKVGPYEVEMVLVKEVTFMMGYDGRGSMAMHSEPVHPVRLTSFYVNVNPLSKDLVGYLKKGKEEFSKKESRYSPYTWYNAHDIVMKLADASSMPVDLITEAQWEYVAVTRPELFSLYGSEKNFCRDYYAEYRNNDVPQVDPVVTKNGSLNVSRFFSGGSNIYDRSIKHTPSLLSGIRFTFPAQALLDKVN